MKYYKCPECNEPLKEIQYPGNSFLNYEQFMSTRAGDYYCDKCKGTRSHGANRFFWKHELKEQLIGEQLELLLLID